MKKYISASLLLVVGGLIANGGHHQHKHHGHDKQHGHGGHMHQHGKHPHGHGHGGGGWAGIALGADGLYALPAVLALKDDLGTRFSKITGSPELAYQELSFWLPHLKGQALLLGLGLQDTQSRLKGRAFELHKKFEQYKSQFNQNSIASALPLCKQLRELEKEVFAKVHGGEWIGWIFPSEVRHMMLELDYLIDKLNGVVYSAAQELAFWNMVNADNAFIIARLLDPSEHAKIKEAMQFGKKSMHRATLDKESDAAKSIESLKKWITYLNTLNEKRTPALQSVLHPQMLENAGMVARRAIEVLEGIKK